MGNAETQKHREYPWGYSDGQEITDQKEQQQHRWDNTKTKRFCTSAETVSRAHRHPQHGRESVPATLGIGAQTQNLPKITEIKLTWK